MIFRTDKHVERARALIDEDDPDKLRYASLELRYAIERIAYQKLQQRLDKISAREIAAWQPRRALEILTELVDENLTQNSVLSVAAESSPGTLNKDARFIEIGENRGISPK